MGVVSGFPIGTMPSACCRCRRADPRLPTNFFLAFMAGGKSFSPILVAQSGDTTRSSMQFLIRERGHRAPSFPATLPRDPQFQGLTDGLRIGLSLPSVFNQLQFVESLSRR